MAYRKSLGSLGEAYAIKLYQAQNYIIIAQNSFNHRGKQLGELDFVAVRDNRICFVEVKTRTSVQFGLPEAAVGRYKQAKLIKATQWFLMRYPKYIEFIPQIDVCAILLNRQVEKADQVDLANIDKIVKYAKIYSNAVEMK